MNIFDEIRARYSPADLASEHGIEAGRKQDCPFCGHRLSFFCTAEYYRCHHASCGKRGDVISLMVDLGEAGDRVDAARKLADRLGIRWQHSEETEKQEKAQDELLSILQQLRHLPDEAREYLHGRGITDDTIDRKLIGFVPPGCTIRGPNGFPQNLKSRIIIPFWRFGRPVYVTGRALLPEHMPKYLNQQGPKTYSGTISGSELWIVEGPLDQLMMEQAGKQCIALAGSGSLPRELERYKGTVYMLFDADQAGRKYVERHAVEAAEWGVDVRIATLPEDGQDPAEYVRLGGDLETLRRSAVPAAEHYRIAWEADPQDRPKREVLFRAIKNADTIVREQVFKSMARTLNAGVGVIRKAFEEATETKRDTAYKSAEGEVFGVPEGYAMGRAGILSITASGKDSLVASCPMYIDQKGIDDLGGDYYRIRYEPRNLPGSLRTKIVPSTYISQTSLLRDLGADGIAVNDANALKLVTWFDLWIKENAARMQEFLVSRNLGWVNREGRRVFVLPGKIVDPGSEEPLRMVYVGPQLGADAGAFAASGTLDGWSSAVGMLGRYPDAYKARFGLYAALASLILEEYGARTNIIHYHGDTSTGKTSVLELVASTIGKPGGGDAMFRWHGTKNWIQRTAETLRNIPFILDESSSEKGNNMEDIVYMLEGGMGKGKASKNDAMKTEVQRKFCLMVFSSGEGPLSGRVAQGGSDVRLWELNGSPFGGPIPDEDFRAMKDGIRANYGHAAEAFIRAWWPARSEVAELYTSGIVPDAQRQGMSTAEKRLMQQLSLVWAAGEVANKLFGWGWSVREDVLRVLEDLSGKLRESTRTVQQIFDFWEDKHQQFPGRFIPVRCNESGGYDPVKVAGWQEDRENWGYAVYRDTMQDATPYELLVNRGVFLDVMDTERRGSNSGKATLNLLSERGFIEPDQNRARVYVWHRRVRVVRLPIGDGTRGTDGADGEGRVGQMGQGQNAPIGGEDDIF